MSQRDWQKAATLLGLAATGARLIASLKTGHSLTCTCGRCALPTLAALGVSMLSLRTLAGGARH